MGTTKPQSREKLTWPACSARTGEVAGEEAGVRAPAQASTRGAQLADRWGVPVLGGDRGGGGRVRSGGRGACLALAGDPAAAAQAAVTAAPRFVLAQVYLAYLNLYGTTAAGVAAAQRIVAELDEAAAAGQRPLPEREALHLRAARAWAGGDWAAAARALERALVAHPRDALALKVAQDLYFFLGRRLDLRDVAGRVLARWPAGEPGWGYVQGMYAFGLEENGDYRQAQARAQAALAGNPRDVWSVHALAHVHEMEGRHTEGVAFLTATSPDWRSSYFAVHNWWHQGLYYIELGEIGPALALYDSSVRASRSVEWLDIVDAAALLWRLALYGADLGDRAARLADDITPLLDGPGLRLQRLARRHGPRAGRAAQRRQAGAGREPAARGRHEPGGRPAGRERAARRIHRLRGRPARRRARSAHRHPRRGQRRRRQSRPARRH